MLPGPSLATLQRVVSVKGWRLLSAVTDCGFGCSWGSDMGPEHSHTEMNTHGFSNRVWAMFCNMEGGKKPFVLKMAGHRKR